MLISMKAREMEYEEFLSDQDNQVWKSCQSHGKDT